MTFCCFRGVAVPIYEYQCDNCKHKLECIQKIDDDPLLTCPKCDTDSLRKLVSKTSFRLKGAGWYATDFKDKPKKTAAGKEHEPSPVTKDDVKPAEKPAAESGSGQKASDTA